MASTPDLGLMNLLQLQPVRALVKMSCKRRAGIPCTQSNCGQSRCAGTDDVTYCICSGASPQNATGFWENSTLDPACTACRGMVAGAIFDGSCNNNGGSSPTSTCHGTSNPGTNTSSPGTSPTNIPGTSATGSPGISTNGTNNPLNNTGLHAQSMNGIALTGLTALLALL